MSACEALASSITSNYLSNATFNPTFSLTEYLSSTGVLISMCLDRDCTDNSWPMKEPHLSGSWLQHSSTGPRYFGGHGGVGMIFDPHQVDIRCLYPLDAYSDARIEGGCGALGSGIEFNWFERQWLRTRIRWRKWRSFPVTPWDEIPCSDFIKDRSLKKSDLQRVFGMKDHNQTWMTTASWIELNLRGLVGHQVCYDDLEPVFPDDTDESMLAYTGPDSWLPYEWNESTKVTFDVVNEHPGVGIWNEVVMSDLASVSDYEQAVQAIFYVLSGPDDGYRDQAFEEAQALGGKPVLEFWPGNESWHFRCVSSGEESMGRRSS